MNKLKFSKDNFFKIIVFVVLVLLGACFRLIPHLPNFAPIVAISLFGGFYFSKKIALFLPLIIMVISDVFIGYYEIGLMVAVYGSFSICVLTGFWLKNHKKWNNILGSSILSSFIFFLLTNFAVWIFTPWYSKTIIGVFQCYLMALPFFRNSLFGDLFYVSLFFGSYELIKALTKEKIKINGPAFNKSSLV